jgi:hypothetical protein
MDEWWKSWPWRFIQTNLREIDMLDIDADRYVADLREFKATVTMINTAGIIASYPTKLPYHTQSPFLNGASLKEITAACHEAGIKVIARTDFSKIRRPVYEMHPEWATISPAGKIVEFEGNVHACVNAGFQQEYALRIIEEAITTLDMDGIFFNMGGYQVRDYAFVYHGICQCESCTRLFRERFDLPLPRVEDMSDPAYRKYLVFKRETVWAHKAKVDAFIHRIRPDMAIDRSYELASGFLRQESNTGLDRPLPHWQYSGTDNTRWAVTTCPGLVSSNSSVDYIDFPTRHVAVSPHQQKLRMVEGLANGGGLDFFVIGRLDNHEDKSGYAGIREVFHFHAAHEEDYRDLESRATVLLLKAPESQEEYRGWFRFLLESHHLFDVCAVASGTDISWDRYRTIVLPDVRYMSDALAVRLDAFAQAGGTVVASGRSGLYDGDYEKRATPALKCLGVRGVDAIRDDMRGAYFKLSAAEQKRMPRFAVTSLAYLEGEYVFAAYDEKASRHLELLPPQPFGPPERCYPVNPVVDRPAFVVNTHGKGKGAYFPWLPGALFHRQGYPNTSDLVTDALESVLGVEPVRGNLPPMVQVTHLARRDGRGELVHLVNHTGHFGVSFLAPVTLHDLVVELAVERKPRSVRSLGSGAPVEHDWTAGRLMIKVPTLAAFEALKLEA